MKKRVVPNQLRVGVLIVCIVVVVAGFSPRSTTTSQVHRKALGVAEETPAAAQVAVNTKSEDAVQLNADVPASQHTQADIGNCAASCGEGQACVAGRCVCALGHGGHSCEFSINDIYHTDYQTLYEGMRENPEVFRPLDLQGWSPPAEVYEEMLERVNAVTVIELGVWKGLSTSHIANWLKKKNRGVIISIDTWLGAPEFWGRKPIQGEDPERGMSLRFGWPTVFYSFISNILHQSLEDVVVPLPLPSAQAAALLRHKSLEADLIHIDASHEYGPVRADIITWWPFVRPGGVLMGDDFIEFWSGVVKAVQEFALQCGLEVWVTGGVKWWLEKPLEMPPGLPVYCYKGDETQYFGDNTDADF